MVNINQGNKEPGTLCALLAWSRTLWIKSVILIWTRSRKVKARNFYIYIFLYYCLQFFYDRDATLLLKY